MLKNIYLNFNIYIMSDLRNAIIRAISWMIPYLFIRRLLNPENGGNVERFYMDTLYGGLAQVFAYYFNKFIVANFK
jgi:hypothetical protein